MMTQETEKVRKQMQIVCIDDLVPKDHLLRLIDRAIDWTFIYDLVPHFSTFGKTILVDLKIPTYSSRFSSMSLKSVIVLN